MKSPGFKSRAFACLTLAGVLAVGSCEKKPSPTSATKPIDACALLTGAEIEAIEGSPIKDHKSSGNSSAGLRVSQCFYSAAEFSRSVSLTVTQSDSTAPNPRSVKSYWEDAFGRYEGKADEEKGDKEKRESLKKETAAQGEEEGTPPKKVSGVGDAAYWTQNRVGGALYVLHNDVMIRISVGGPDPIEKKIEKCKALAEKALARL